MSRHVVTHRSCRAEPAIIAELLASSLSAAGCVGLVSDAGVLHLDYAEDA